MGRDEGVILIALAFPVLLAGTTAGVFYLQRCLVTAQCPSCRRRIPKVALRDDGATCVLCEDRKPALSDGAERTCRRCQVALDVVRAMRFWDGHVYCEPCMAQAHPDLPRRASEHRRMQETMPHSAWKVGRNTFLLVEGAASVIFGIPAVWAGVEHWGGVWGGLLGFLTIQIIIFPLVCVFAGAAAAAFALDRPTVCVTDGTLGVVAGSSSYSQFPLTECEWFHGSVEYVLPLLSGEAIVVILPQTEARQRHAAVGFNSQTRAIWAAFLTLAGIPRRADLETNPSRLRKAIDIVVAILALPICFGLGLLASVIVSLALLAVTGDRDLSVVLAFPLFVPGCIYALFYFLLLWPWSLRPTPVARTPEKQATVRRVTLLVVLAINTLIAVTVLLSDLPVQGRLGAAAVLLFSTWPIGRDLGARLAQLGQNTVPRR